MKSPPHLISERRGKKQEEKLTLNKRINFSSIISIRPSKKLKNAPSDKAAQKQRRLTELDLHYDNIKTVIRCSNATPIRCRVGDRYACGYCLDQYADPRDLKRHTLAKHRDCDDKLECLNIRSLSKYNVHLDITNLKCTNCNCSIDTLQGLIEHLKSEHEEPFHSHIRNLMVPYKFEGAGLRCCLCPVQVESYEQLQQHMAEHCRNYVCEFCDKPFLARHAMLDHKKDVHHV